MFDCMDLWMFDCVDLCMFSCGKYLFLGGMINMYHGCMSVLYVSYLCLYP
jgi:hypothetical protein